MGGRSTSHNPELHITCPFIDGNGTGSFVKDSSRD